MTDHRHTNSWEPDPRQVSTNWQSMFDTRRAGPATEQPAAPPQIEDDLAEPDAAHFDLTEYKPWVLQRARTRPALMLELRRYEARSGLWQGWAMPYHNLYAVEYVGDRMLTLDFGARQFMVEGRDLDYLGRYLRQGTVLTINEYSSSLWPAFTDKPAVTSICRLGAA